MDEGKGGKVIGGREREEWRKVREERGKGGREKEWIRWRNIREKGKRWKRKKKVD